MIRQRKFGLALIGASLLLSTFSPAQEKAVKIKLTIKHNGHAVPGPDRITLSSDGYVARVPVRNGKFDVPTEISHAKTWRLAAAMIGSQIEISNLSHGELAYEDWTVHLADRHYNENYAYAVPKGADIRSSCILVLESQRIDPGLVIFQTHCRSKG